ncbi:dTMP kinase [Thermosynechococcus vestitus]|uniref:Thymidylate kinase n=1 Tax=Thermosynechococcus vestitus (strain NIES-2133 / IAM M-273 / BP-1) TaxID=197221 RepID=KTHY_THEVB|nr:dTMP kinase [Thermosynechococcus vestitus]Q8DHA4.1 RecName: Full=Thymidylate kinase; AltName: Full=dTMP kinase [Thermosynechococcus vestitus BP-1]BAC09607.1 thymidylate kinase [Thermosynechococcus vestitus BP-1]
MHSATHPYAGLFIVLEGGEGAGKTTQMGAIATWLENSGWLAKLRSCHVDPPLLLTREPGGTPLGQGLRQLLLHSDLAIDPLAELLLYAADRAQHVAMGIRPQLQRGGIVLCDRYTASTVAYQGYGRGLDLQIIQHINQMATGGLGADLVLWLDLPVAVGLARTQQRGRGDRLEQNAVAFHERVRQGFLALAQQGSDRWQRIDADQPPDQVTQAIQECLAAHLHRWFETLKQRLTGGDRDLP